MSGWSTLSVTIFAARRVPPPDLVTPANESKPFMNETGPEATPPFERPSMLDRRGERFEPVPEPPLKSMTSFLARSMMSFISSRTD
jgi:hypothetical protein